MRYLFFFLSFHISIVSEVLTLEMEGVIGSERFVIISLNAIGDRIDSWNPPTENTFFLGAIELNIFNNEGSGTVRLTNSEYDATDSIFRALLSGGTSTDQIKLLLKVDRNTSGTPISFTDLTPADPATIRTTTGVIENEITTIEFYLQDHEDNVTDNGAYISFFTFEWVD